MFQDTWALSAEGGGGQQDIRNPVMQAQQSGAAPKLLLHHIKVGHLHLHSCAKEVNNTSIYCYTSTVASA